MESTKGDTSKLFFNNFVELTTWNRRILKDRWLAQTQLVAQMYCLTRFYRNNWVTSRDLCKWPRSANGRLSFHPIPCGTALIGHVTSGGTSTAYIHFRLSLWTTMHLRMRCATPSVYLDLCEGRVEHDRAKRLARRLQLGFLRWFLNKELQTIMPCGMCFPWTVNKTGKYLATVQFLLSPLETIRQRQSW